MKKFTKKALKIMIGLIPFITFILYSLNFISNNILGYLYEISVIYTLMLILKFFYNIFCKENNDKTNEKILVKIIILLVFFSISTTKNWEIVKTKYFSPTIGKIHHYSIKLRNMIDDERAEICFWNKLTNEMSLFHSTFPYEGWDANRRYGYFRTR